ncbi:MAG: hypothetical protein JRD89_00545 [Deltaproteobacteria bacterium]|nr:hypothetical protein [Deltaproteobacteria bacterium]
MSKSESDKTRVEELLEEVLERLRRIEEMLQGFEERLKSKREKGGELATLASASSNGIIVTDPETLKTLQDYERRSLAEFKLKMGPPPRLPGECPKCYEKGQRVGGRFVEAIDFKKSTAWIMECPVCGHRWAAQFKKPRA